VGPVRDKVWQFLMGEPWLRILARDPERFDDMVARARALGELVRHDRRQPGSSVDQEVGPDDRLLALATIVAIVGCRRPDVRSFRSRHLPDGLLEPARAPAWLRQQHAADGETSTWVTVSVPVPATISKSIGQFGPGGQAQTLRQLANVAQDLFPSTGISYRPAVLQVPDEWREEGPLFVNAAGVLGQLQKLAQELSTTDLGGRPAPWPSEASAVDFILTGRPPRLPMFQLAGEWVPALPGEPDPSVRPPLTRLRLEVNPRMSSDRVRALYSRARVAAFGAGRDKPMEAKHLALAVFVERHRLDGMKWPQLRDLWNQECNEPEWRFDMEDPVANRFGRDARLAWSRVTGMKWAGLRVGVPKGGEQ